jgi:hypothetical protein
MPTSMPDIGDRARKQRPGLPPIGAIIVRHLAELAGVEIDAGTLPPRRIVRSNKKGPGLGVSGPGPCD